jgi:hypothetical protein
MIAIINNFQVDLSKPIDISIPVVTDANPICLVCRKARN